MDSRSENVQINQKAHRQYLEEFLGNYQKLNKSDHTIKNYRSDLAKFMRWYEFTHNSDISYATSIDIDLYKDFLSGIPFYPRRNMALKLLRKLFKRSEHPMQQNPPLSVGSMRRHISAIKNFYEYMIQAHDGKLKGFKANPVKSKIHAIKLKDSDIEHTKLLTEAHFDLLLKNSQGSQERLILHLLYYGGLRLEELTRLKISSFSQRQQTLSVIRKGGSLHTFKLQHFDAIFALLVEHLNWRTSRSDQLFLNRFSMPISTRGMYGRISRMFKRSGLSTLGLGPHSFRKACATNLYIQNKDILQVRNYLNHKDAKVTQTYIEYHQ